MTKIINSIEEIADEYDAFLCDVWGVIHNGRIHFKKALEALRLLRSKNKPVILISNSPRPSSQIPAQLASLDIDDSIYDGIVTSGDATLALVKKFGTHAYAIAAEKDEFLLKSTGAQFVDMQDAQYIICTGPRNDLVETAEDYRDELKELASHNLPFICANPDRVVQFGGRLITCAGALADVYEELGGKVLMPGKPYSPIYDLTFDALAKVAGKEIDKANIICIGDGVQTDVEGANNQGLDCLFITGGIHGSELSNESGLDEEKTSEFLKSRGLKAKYAMIDLK